MGRDRGHHRRRRAATLFAVVIAVAAPVPVSSHVLAQPGPSDPAPAQATEGDDACSLPQSWSELTSAGRLGCNARQIGTLLVWIGVVLLLAYLVLAVLFRPVPLSAERGALGTFRRGRERLPIVGRAYRPRIELTVTDADGATGSVARSIHELLISEMGPASDEAWFRERLTGAGFNADLSAALESARPGLGAVGTFLTDLLPQERVGIRIQLHDPTPHIVSVTAELLDRGNRSVESRVFWSPRLATGDEPAITDHYLLVRPVAAWLAFQLYKIWPGEADEAPRPVNTSSAESFGEFRRGDLLESVHQLALARSAYHQAISLDGDNVGALVNLALLDSRDRERVEWCRARLDDARVLVDGIRSEEQQAEMRVRIQHVQAVASLNRLMWDEDRLDDAGRFAALADCTANVQHLARTLQAFAAATRRDARGSDQRDRWMAKLGKPYEHRAVALGACIAIEHERIGVRVRSVRPVDVRSAIARLADGGLLSFRDCIDALDKRGKPISTAATYILSCALARRLGVPGHADSDAARLDALSYLREALAGDPSLVAWVGREDGDPAFATLRSDPRWDTLLQEFSPPSVQVAAAATKT